MALINFLFGNTSPSGFELRGVVEFQADLTNRELHERSAEVTSHPIETGATISDHVITQPDKILLEGFITDTPVAIFAAQQGRTQNGFDILNEAFNAREPIQIVTGFGIYENMIITRLTLPRERPSSMQFILEATRVIIAGTQTALLPAEEAEDIATEQDDEGRQTADPVPPEIEETQQSTLARLLDWFRLT